MLSYSREGSTQKEMGRKRSLEEVFSPRYGTVLKWNLKNRQRTAKNRLKWAVELVISSLGFLRRVKVVILEGDHLDLR